MGPYIYYKLGSRDIKNLKTCLAMAPLDFWLHDELDREVLTGISLPIGSKNSIAATA